MANEDGIKLWTPSAFAEMFKDLPEPENTPEREEQIRRNMEKWEKIAEQRELAERLRSMKKPSDLTSKER